MRDEGTFAKQYRMFHCNNATGWKEGKELLRVEPQKDRVREYHYEDHCESHNMMRRAVEEAATQLIKFGLASGQTIEMKKVAARNNRSKNVDGFVEDRRNGVRVTGLSFIECDLSTRLPRDWAYYLAPSMHERYPETHVQGNGMQLLYSGPYTKLVTQDCQWLPYPDGTVVAELFVQQYDVGDASVWPRSADPNTVLGERVDRLSKDSKQALTDFLSSTVGIRVLTSLTEQDKQSLLAICAACAPIMLDGCELTLNRFNRITLADPNFEPEDVDALNRIAEEEGPISFVFEVERKAQIKAAELGP